MCLIAPVKHLLLAIMKKSPLLVALLTVSSYVSGCAILPTSAVSLKRDLQLTEMFENADVPPGYTYYYFGPDAAPTVILGMTSTHNFHQGLWKKVDLSPEKLKAWTEFLDVKYRVGPHYYSAAHIIDREDKEIGIWYSYHLWPTVKINQDGTVSVFPPDDPSFDRRHPPFLMKTP